MICSAKAQAVKQGNVTGVTVLSEKTDATGQLAQIRDLIAKGVKVLLINPADKDSLNPAIKEAIDAGIAVVAIDAPVSAPGAYNLSNDQENYAYLGAKWLFEQLGGKGAVVYMRGIPGHPADTDRDKGFKKALAENPGITIAKETSTNWDQKTGTDQINEILSSGTKFDGVWTSGIDNVIVEALQKANHLVPIVGADNSGFVKQLLTDPGPQGRRRDQPAGRRWRGRRARRAAARRPEACRRERPCHPGAVGQHHARGQGQAHRGPDPGSPGHLAARPDRQGLDDLRRRPPSRTARARARADLPGPSRSRTGMPVHAGIPVPHFRPRIHRTRTRSNTMTDLLLEATGVAKHYGAVAALRSASLAVRPGEVHALMGANGAGKSTLVKILTGAVHPDRGTILVRGKPFVARSPSEARRGGIMSVYQEPSLVPDLDIASNLRLTRTPVEPFRAWLAELGIPSLDLTRAARAASARDAARHRPRPRARRRARRADARRDDRGPSGRPDRTRPRGHRPAARHRQLGHLHLAPHDRDRRRLRPRHGPARRRDGRRRRRRPGLRGADRPADARRHRTRRWPPAPPGTERAGSGRRARHAAPRGREPQRSAPSSPTSPSSSPGRGPRASSRSRARARTSCSTSSPARTAPPAASSWSTVGRCPSAIRPTPSAPASSTSRPTAPRRC